jgi:hypothetical protein
MARIALAIGLAAVGALTGGLAWAEYLGFGIALREPKNPTRSFGLTLRDLDNSASPFHWGWPVFCMETCAIVDRQA